MDDRTKDRFTPQWVKDHLEASKVAAGEILKSKETSLRFLQEAGIIDADGKLSEPYRKATS